MHIFSSLHPILLRFFFFFAICCQIARVTCEWFIDEMHREEKNNISTKCMGATWSVCIVGCVRACVYSIKMLHVRFIYICMHMHVPTYIHVCTVRVRRNNINLSQVGRGEANKSRSWTWMNYPCTVKDIMTRSFYSRRNDENGLMSDS